MFYNSNNNNKKENLIRKLSGKKGLGGIPWWPSG